MENKQKKERKKEIDKRYYLRNRDKVLERVKKYRLNNLDEVNEKKREWYLKNCESEKARGKINYQRKLNGELKWKKNKQQ